MSTTSDIARRAKNAYHRQWQKNNPDKVKAAQEKYWIKKASEILEREKASENNR